MFQIFPCEKIKLKNPFAAKNNTLTTNVTNIFITYVVKPTKTLNEMNRNITFVFNTWLLRLHHENPSSQANIPFSISRDSFIANLTLSSTQKTICKSWFQLWLLATHLRSSSHFTIFFSFTMLTISIFHISLTTDLAFLC